MTQTLAKRACKECGAHLSRYNEGEYCAPCSLTAVTATERLIEQIHQAAAGRQGSSARGIAEELIDHQWELVLAWFTDSSRVILTGFVKQHLNAVRQARLHGTSHTRSGASVFDATFVVDPAATRKRLGEMYASDHTFVAQNYGLAAARAGKYESIHRAIAKKLGEKRTDEVFTEDQIVSLFGDEAPMLLECSVA